MKSRRLKQWVGYTLLFAVMLAVLGVQEAQAVPNVRLGRVLDGGSSASTMYSSGDLTGTLTTLTPGGFDATSVASLVANYDVLLIGCCSSTTINADWNTRLLPFMNAGGGVIWENPYDNNLSDLSAVISAIGPAGGGGSLFAVSATVPGLTDGINNSFVNGHINISAHAASLSPFLSQTGSPLGVGGLYGSFGSGRFVFTSPDNFLHGSKGAGGTTGNMYNLALNEVIWASQGAAAVPEPSTLLLLGTGLVGLAACGRRKRKA